MKQRPILFSTPMVQAILEGRKTMTRRSIGTFSEAEFKSFGFVNEAFAAFFDAPEYRHIIKCPYGKQGDVLWVRETWQPSANDVFVHFKADCVGDAGKGWKPSIHMRKDDARIWLKITDVRVEHVQDISREDSRAEGIKRDPLNGVQYVNYMDGTTTYNEKTSFESLWQSINGGHYFSDWSLNPWVWVIEFERIEKP